MKNSFKDFIIRVLLTAIILAIAALLTRGFKIDNIWTLLVASLVVSIIDHLVQSFTGLKASPFGRGIAGFLVTVLVLLLTSKLVAGFNISLWSSIIASLIIGILDMVIPGSTF